MSSGHVYHRRNVGLSRPLWRPLLYIDAYFWLVLASLCNAILSCLTLRLEGALIAPWIDSVIKEAGIPFLMAVMLLLVTSTAALCEEIGRRRPGTGRRIVKLVITVTWLVCAVHVYGLI